MNTFVLCLFTTFITLIVIKLPSQTISYKRFLSSIDDLPIDFMR